MSVGYQIKEVLEQIMWMGVAFGIVGYFIYREWGRGGLWRGIGRLYWIGNNEKQSFASLRHKQRCSRLSDNSTYRVDDGTVYLLRISDRAQAPAFGRASLLGRTEINRILIFSGTGLHLLGCNPVFHVENRPSEVSRPRPWRLRLWFCRAVRRGRRRARRSGRRRPCGG